MQQLLAMQTYRTPRWWFNHARSQHYLATQPTPTIYDFSPSSNLATSEQITVTVCPPALLHMETYPQSTAMHCNNCAALQNCQRLTASSNEKVYGDRTFFVFCSTSDSRSEHSGEAEAKAETVDCSNRRSCQGST